MRRSWLLFSQVVTVLLAVYFVVASLQPQWLSRHNGQATVAVIEAPAGSTAKVPGGAPGSAAPGQQPAAGAAAPAAAGAPAV